MIFENLKFICHSTNINKWNYFVLFSIKSNNEGGSARTSVGSVGVANLPGKCWKYYSSEDLLYRLFSKYILLNNNNRCLNFFSVDG